MLNKSQWTSFKRFLSMVLSVVMMLQMFPAGAIAEGLQMLRSNMASGATYYTVKFVKGDKTTTANVLEGTAIGEAFTTLSLDPGQDWKDESGNTVTRDTVVTGDMTVTAVDVWTVTFRNRDGEVIETRTVERGKAVGTLPAVIEREDYTASWAVGTSSGGDQIIWTAGELIDSSYTPTADVDIIPAYTTIKHIVTFYDSEEKTTVIATKTVDVNTNYCLNDMPAVPAKEGSIGRWVYGNGEPFTNMVACTKDTDVWAEYTQNVFTVTFKVGEETYETEVYFDGDALTLPAAAPVLEGQEFLGWYIGETKYEGGETVSKNLTLTARFSGQYKITFIANGVEQLSFYRSANEIVGELPEDPFQAGKVFQKWVIQGTDTEVTKDTIVSGNMTAEAVFRGVMVYTIRAEYWYKTNDGTPHTWNVDINQVEEDDLPYTLRVPASTKTNGDYVAGSPVYYASQPSIVVKREDFNEINRECTVEIEYVSRSAVYDFVYMLKNLDGNGYTEFDRAENVSGVLNSTVTPEIKSYPYADFESAETAEITSSGMEGQTKQEIKAYYTRKGFQLSYDTDGGSYVAGVTAPYGTEITLASDENQPTRAGYTFDGWYLDAERTQPAGETVTLEKNTTIYAKWKGETVGYTVVYMVEKYNDAGTATEYIVGNTKTQQGTVGSTVEAKNAAALTGDNANYREKDTEKNNSSSVVIAADGSSVLYVYYRLKEYTFYFNAGTYTPWFTSYDVNATLVGKGSSGTGTLSYTMKVKLGQDISSAWPANVNGTYTVKTWFSSETHSVDFAGWLPGDSNILYVTKRTTVTEDMLPTGNNNSVTYTAQWTSNANTYTVNYWLQNAEGDGYTKSEEYSQVYNSSGGNLQAKDITGYKYDHGNSGANNTTTYNFYYNRLTYAIEYYHGANRLERFEHIRFGAPISNSKYNWTPTADQCGVDDDYTFAGWYDNSNLNGEPYVFSTMPAGATEDSVALMLYPKWNPSTYTVSYVDGEDTSTKLYPDDTVEKYKKVSNPGTAYKAGYVFDGWYTAADGKEFYDWNTQITEDTTVYAHWTQSLLSYTVHYVDENNNPVANDKVVTSPNLAVGQEITEQALAVAGYRPDKPSKALQLAAEDNEITFVYSSKESNTGYTVHYILDPSEYPGNIKVATEKTVNNVPADQASVIEMAAEVNYELLADHSELAGLVFHPDAAQKTFALTAKVESNVYTFLYSAYKTAKITVNYVDMNGQAIADPYEQNLKVGNIFTLSRPPIAGWELNKAVEGAAYNGTEAGTSYRITGNTVKDGLTFTLFYQKKLTVTAKSYSKQYDGKALTLPADLGGQVTTEGLLEGDSLASVAFTYANNDVENGRLNAGIATVTPTNATIQGTHTQKNYYKIRYISGTLTVTKINVTIRIEPDRWVGNTYDGTEKKTGFTNASKGIEDYIIISHAQYKTDHLDQIWEAVQKKATKDASAQGLQYYCIAEKDAGDYTYDIGLTAANLPQDDNYSVSLYVRKGRLQILPRTATVTTGSASRQYNGEPLKREDGAVITGLVAGENAKVTATGSQTEVGSSSNTYEIEWAEGVKANNYAITENLGTLTVTKRKTYVYIKGQTDEKVYNGENQSVSGYKIQTIANTDPTAQGAEYAPGENPYSPEYIKFTPAQNAVMINETISAQGKDVGTYPMGLQPGQFINKNKNFDVTFIVEDGWLNITPAKLTVTTGSASKAYDGTALTNAEASITGFVNGETATITATGSQTAIGTSNNTYEIVWDTAESKNYKIKEELGTLEVKQNYAVTYIAEGDVPAGYTAPVDPTPYMEGQSVTVRPTPDVPGYDFDGWKWNGTTTTGFEMPKGNVELRGKFTEKEVVITYQSEDTSLGNVSPANTNVKAATGTPGNATATAQKPGYVFSHWTLKVGSQEVAGYLNENATVEPAKNDDPNAGGLWTERTYIAHFKPVDYKVTYTVTGDVPAGYAAPAGESGKHVGDTVTVAAAPTEEGYTFTGWTVKDDAATIANGELTMPASDVTLEGVWKINEYSYTVHHYLKGTEIQVKKDDTGSAKFGSTVTAKPATTFESLNLTVDSYSPTQTITVKTDNNIITVYYTLPLTIEAVTKSKVYDGTPLTGEYRITGARTSDTATIQNALGNAPSIVNVTDSPKDYLTESEQESISGIPGYYVPTYKKGTLTITPATITVTAVNYSDKYDGATHIGGATPSVTEGTTIQYSTDGGKTWSENVPSIKDAGTVNYKVKATNTNYGEATAEGILTVTKRSVTLTSASGEKVYDGTALTKNAQTDITVSGDGFVNSEGATYTITGTQTDVGDSKNTFTYALNDGTKANNYSIRTTEGTLKVTPKAVTVTANNDDKTYGEVDPELTATVEGLVGEDTITYTVSRAAGEDVGEYTITAAGEATQGNYTVTYKTGTFTITKATLILTTTGYEGVYDGVAHSAAAVASVTEGTIIEYKVGDHEWSTTAPSIKDVGEQSVEVRATNPNYKTATNACTLKVTPRQVTLTSETASKPYDGTPLTKPDVTVSEDGFVEGEVSGVKATGSVTTVAEGEKTNTITYTEGKGFKAENYNIKKNEGKLKITPIDVTVTIKGHNDTADYDGEVHTVTGYDVAIGNPLYKESDFTFSGTATATRTNVVEGEDTDGQTDMGLAAEQFTNTNANFKTVTFEVTDGYQKINPIDVTVVLHGNTSSLPYDGENHTVTGYTVDSISSDLYTEADFALKEGKEATATRKDQGKTMMGLTGADFENKNGNFGTVTFTYTDGYQEITPIDVTVVLHGNTSSLLYNGENHTVTGYTVDSISSDLYTEADFALKEGKEATATRKDQGKTMMGLEDADFENKNANFGTVTFTYTDGYQTINKRVITVSVADAADVEYDGNEHTGETEYTFDNVVEGQTATITYTPAKGTLVGTYTGSYGEDLKVMSGEKDVTENYTLTTKTLGSLTITDRTEKYEITVKANSSTGNVYDGTEKSASGFETLTFEVEENTYTVEGLTTSDPKSIDVTTLTNAISGTAVVKDAAGNDVTAQFAVSTENGTLEITPATITIKADAKTKVYDNDESTDPVLTATVTGVPEKGVAPSYSLSRAEGQDVNEYAITVTAEAASNPNYTVTVEGGTFKITPVAITIKADDQTKAYDNDETTDPELTATVTGVPANGTAPVYSLSRVEGQDVNEYAVTVTTEEGKNPNYTVSVEGGTFTITPVAITIKADDKTKVYDNDPTTDPALTATVTGVPANGIAPEYSLSRVEGQDVNEYAVTVTTEEGKNPNYTVTVEGGTFSITPAAITIKADDQTKVYDNDESTDPELTATVTGVPANGTAPVYSLSREAGQDVNEYAITVTAEAASNPNYTVTVKDGTFTITPAAITIKADNKTKAYDNDPTSDPVLTATVTGVPEKGVDPSYSLSRAEGQNVNEYAITVTAEAASNPNYTVSVEGGTFTITPAAITITADDKTKAYDNDPTSDPVLTATVTGVPANGTAPVYSLSREEGQNVAEYAITVTAEAASNPNYTVTVEGGTFEITPAAITIKADDKTKVYDNDESTDPALTATVTGVPEKGVAPTYRLSREAGQDVAEYAITVTAEAASNPNYTVTVEGGTFTITPAAITIKADNKTKAYDNDPTTDPELTATVTGVPANGTAPVYSLSREAGQDVKDYAITVTAEAASNPNYTVTVEGGTFTITPAAITIKADDQTKVYDNDESTDPELTATVTGVPEKGVDPSYSLSREAGQDVDEYAITVTAEAASNPNYTVTVEGGTFTITPAAITIKADDKTKTYGDADPELTATVNGAVEGDEIKYTLSREAGENVNEYAITVNTGENPNYTVKVEDGAFAITPKAVTITVDAKTKEFGEEDPELTATVTGAVGDDKIQYTLTREPGEDVGEYKITALVENDANPNYTVTVEENAFVITAPTAYTLTVRYWYDTVDGRTAAKTFVKVYEAGSAYNVASPSITGYTPDRTRVTGTLTQDRVEDVIYTLNAYTLTVRYIFEDGSQAAPTYTDTLYYSADYSIASPVIDGYTVSNRRISGTMPARNVERTVVYVADGTRIANVVIEDFDTPLGLRNLTLNTGEAIE